MAAYSRQAWRGRHCFLFIVVWSLPALTLLACGGGDNAAPQVPELTGTRAQPDGPAGPREDPEIARAPTEQHRRLVRLLPTASREEGSVRHAGWNPEAATLSDEDPSRTLIPVTHARYLSSGFRVLEEQGTREVERTHPQRCDLFLIKAPDAYAAQAFAEGIQERLLAGGFSRAEPIALRVTGASASLSRFRHDVAEENALDRYISYLHVRGHLVIYAIESESLAADDPAAGLPPAGTRVGAQIVALVVTAAAQ
jgi:hypothetical protein